MKNIKYILSTLAVLLFSLQSCTEDLDTLPEDDDVRSAELTTAEDFRAFLAGVYGNMGQPGQTGAFDSSITGIDGGTSTFTRTLWYMQTLTTDEAIWSYENDAGVADLQRNIWTDANPFPLGMFARASQTIAFANELIRQSEGLTDENVAGISAYRAEARFIRALNYYYLLDLFGKAPFVTAADPVNASFKPPQIAGEELFNFIEAEGLELTTLLLTKSSPGFEYGRATQAAARMLLAKLYLNAEVYIGQPKYTEAITQLNGVVNAASYMLEGDYHHNFTADNHLSDELIFSIISDGVSVQNFGGTTIIINGEVGSAEGNGNDLGVPGFGGALRLKEEISTFLLSPDAGERNSLLIAGRSQAVTNPALQESGYIHTKFKNITSTGAAASNNGETAFVDTDFPVFRLADAYLMYAEAVWRGGAGGSQSMAIDFINRLRTRAAGTSLPSTAALTEEIIFNERSMELFWEGHRRQDLRRFGLYTGGAYNWDFKGNAANGTAIPEFRGLFPIPAVSLDVNPNLTQNPGY